MDKIYRVIRTASYGLGFDIVNLSYHKTQEGAYLKMDQIAEEEDYLGLKKEDDGDDGYFYTDGYYTFSVTFEDLED